VRRRRAPGPGGAVSAGGGAVVPGEPRAAADLRMPDGARVRLRRHGNPRGPRLALSHGNGLAIEGYAPFWSLLERRYDLVLFDLRNHGRNPLHGGSGHCWPIIADDLHRIRRGIDARFGARPTAGVFHSLSAVASLMQVLERGTGWDALVLFDPPLFPPPGHPLVALEAAHMAEMAARARRRPERYRTPRLLALQFSMRAEFRDWPPGGVDRMARATLREEEAGAWRLACPRALEAHIFETNTDETVWPRIPALPVPARFVCGDPGRPGQQPPALLGAALAEAFGVDHVAVPRTSHFLQIERPAECVAAMEAFLARHGLAAR